MVIGGDYSNKGTSNLYSGSDYGFDPVANEEWSVGTGEYNIMPGEFGHAADATTANQLDAVNKKLNTGASTIEVQGLNIMGGGPGAMVDKIPKQHFKEIERLKKLTGSSLTFHAPLMEPSGFTKQGWDERDREETEKQLWSAVERAHQMDEEGNLVVTFHSGVVSVPTETKIKDEQGNEIIQEFGTMDLGKGQYAPQKIKPNYFLGEDGKILSLKEQKEKIQKTLEEQGEEQWTKQLYGIAYHANQGAGVVKKALQGLDEGDVKKTLETYKKFKEIGGSPELLQGFKPGENTLEVLNEVIHGDSYLREAYYSLQGLFNDAYESAKISAAKGNKNDLKKLDKFREKIKDGLVGIKDPTRLEDLGNMIVEGVGVLSSVETPSMIVPLRDFALDKSSDTFANLAFRGYKEFAHGKPHHAAPIISIENPPAGTAPLDRAEDLRDLVEQARTKLSNRLVSDLHLSKKKADDEAAKLIGVTWDVGHINMIRKFGYDEIDTIEEAKTIAPFVKHVHLSDNFGMEHTELPMGMGNVPIKKILELKQGFEKAKKIVETGDWFSRQGGLAMTHSPVRETLRAFGSPIYSMQMSPSWGGSGGAGSYFSGYGRMLPEKHFSTYGAGFSGLPTELGGQMQGVSRASGTPVD